MTNRSRVFWALALACALLVALLPVQAAGSGIIYQVFVRAFADSDGDGIGDLRGLTAKLDYIQGLGAEALWLLPIFPSPSYHGYDVTDYRGIHPDYGTLKDFQALLQAAHSRGIRVLLDIPFNHSSSRHPWFIQSKDPGSPYRSWYHWKQAGEEGMDPDQVVWDAKPWKPMGDSYYYALFWDGMPDLNFNEPAVRQEVIDIARYWLNLGADGFRLDAASHIYAAGETGRSQDLEAGTAFWQQFSAAVKEGYPEAFLLGEVWEPLEARAQLLRGLDAVVNFDVGDRLLPLLKSGGSGAAFVQALAAIYARYEQEKPGHVDAPFLSNHDQTRSFSVLMGRRDKAALAARILLTLPGTPILYYGEEIGMGGAKPDEELRTPMLWGGEDPAQTSWHPSRYNRKTLPVSEQEGDPDSLLNTYRSYAALRGSQPALSTGRLTAYEADNPIPLAYWMAAGEERLLVLHNPSASAQDIRVPEGLAVLRAEPGCGLAGQQASLAPLGSLILREGQP